MTEVRWADTNQRYLNATLAAVVAGVKRHAGMADDDARVAAADWRDEVAAEAAAIGHVPAIDTLTAAFGLSPFERDLLVLCAGVELDSSVGSMCADANRDLSQPWPTFGLAMAALGGAHWTALVPTAPLRRWRLIEVGAGRALTAAPLAIDERIVHHLVGVDYLDGRLDGMVEYLAGGTALPSSQRDTARRVALALAGGVGSRPVVQLCGADELAKRNIAARAGGALGGRLLSLAADAIPDTGHQEGARRLIEREVVLAGSGLFIDGHRIDPGDVVRRRALTDFVDRLQVPVIVATREPLPDLAGSVARFDVRRPPSEEQMELWHQALGGVAGQLNGQIAGLVSQFDLSGESIRGAANDALLDRGTDLSAQETGRRLWDACRSRTRPQLEELAQRIEPAAGWDDLVLPEPQRRILTEIASHARQRAQVYGSWGFGKRGARGLGITALFTGSSGTGKTMAAEVLAGELRLDLYRIDLSSVISKYVGETEKNLRRVFDAAEEGGAVIFFDEADALFGRRSEVRDSHDRYANIEINYLLQRMETYRGLAILATNAKSALDTAFLRRIRFVVSFPFPDATLRTEIWRRIFPDATPVAGLDLDTLARLDVAGGSIRNIALNAAFLAADAGQPVDMGHLLLSAQGEYAKLERPLTAAETRGWA